MVNFGVLHGSMLSCFRKRVEILVREVMFLVVETGKDLKGFVVLRESVQVNVKKYIWLGGEGKVFVFRFMSTSA